MRKLKRRKADKLAKEMCRLPVEDTRVEFLHSGCTILNLALSGQGIEGGWARGRVDNIVGDGSSGKTLCALEVAFWCFNNIKKIKSQIYPKVKKVIIVYNNREGVMDFPVKSMYGPKFYKSVEWACTKTIEEMGRDFLRRLKNLRKGHFLLYIADSWDSFNSEAGQERMREAVDKDKEIDGSFNTEKQRWASIDFFPYCTGELENNKKDATLFIISQVRTKIGVTWGKKKRRAGGAALDFYTHQVAWLREIEKMRKTKLKSKRVYGIKSEARVERSKVSKPFRESNFTILFDYGIDDVNSMIDFVYGPKKKKGFEFNNKKFETRLSLVKYIEENNLEKKLAKKTEKKWYRIEGAFKKEVSKRKRRF